MNTELIDISDNLLGLGNIKPAVDQAAIKLGVQSTPKVVELVKQVSAERVKTAMSNKNLTRGQAIFAQKVNELPAESIRGLKSGALQVVDGERYIAAQASGGSTTQELLQNAPNSAIGITNLNDGKMPSNANMLLEALKVEFANHATSTDADDVEYRNIMDSASLPSAFQNGELEIMADGRVIVPSTPMAKFFAVGPASFADSTGARVVKLKAPKMIPASARIQINWRKPANGSLSASGNDFIKVTLIGSETTTR
ncbi:MAG: hypothetical protein WC967_14705 [Balneolaceae bacterium]